MLSHSKDGTLNETMILKTLDNHYYKDLSDKWKRHIKRMFKNINDDDLIKVDYYEYKDAKPDLVIIVNDKKVHLSVKSGHAPTMHQESVKTFYEFLREVGVPERIISIISFYHYGYSTKKGLIGTPLTRDQILEKYIDKIKEVNDYFASREELIIELIYRAIFRGRLKRDLIDFMYYGNAARGYLLSISDIIRLLTKGTKSNLNTLCFSQLTYVAGSRKLEEDRVNIMKINWPILSVLFYDENFLQIYG